tara:strand:+ start:109 stop:774 length:666 start_codon:yes stop_codon:yes gene_type:complete
MQKLKLISNTILLLIGNGQHAKVVLDIVTENQTYDNIYLFDISSHSNKNFNFKDISIKILNMEEIKNFEKDKCIYFVAIGDNSIRKKEFEKLKLQNFKSINIISKNSQISPLHKIGEGNLINNGVIINHSCKIGDNNIFNTKVSLDHDNIISNNNHLCPGVTCAGGVNISNNVFVGTGSILDKNVSIGENCFISPGSVVTKDISSNKKILSSRNQIIKPVE